MFKRLTFGYGAILLILILLGVFVVLKLHELNRLTQSIALVDEKRIRISEHLLSCLLSQVGFEKKYLISGDRDFYRQFHEAGRLFSEQLAELRLLMDTEEKRRLHKEANKLYQDYTSIFQKETRPAHGDDSATGDREERERIINRINLNLSEILRAARTQREEKVLRIGRISSEVMKVTALMAVCALLTGIAISILNTRSINRPLLRLQKQTNEIAYGRFVKITGITSPPEIKQLADSFNLMCDRLRELDEMKQDFISHVSHALRTPLTAIRSSSSILLESVVESEDKRRELLVIIKEECERLIQAVNKILDLSRMEAKMMEYDFRDSSIIPVLQRAVLKLAPVAFEKHIELELKPLPEIPSIRIDEDRIAQVLDNLLGNALKFTPEDGKITIEAAANGGKGSVAVSISDTGPGISLDNLEQVFDKFMQIDNGGKAHRGTGLGLAIAKRIVTDHGGIIWAESMPGKGSKFTFTLPAVSS